MRRPTRALRAEQFRLLALSPPLLALSLGSRHGLKEQKVPSTLHQFARRRRSLRNAERQTSVVARPSFLTDWQTLVGVTADLPLTKGGPVLVSVSTPFRCCGLLIWRRTRQCTYGIRRSRHHDAGDDSLRCLNGGLLTTAVDDLDFRKVINPHALRLMQFYQIVQITAPLLYSSSLQGSKTANAKSCGS